MNAQKGRLAVAMSYLTRPPDASPGVERDWNWANPILIALAIEERTARTLESLIKELIFNPLEMYSAGFGETDARKNAAKPNEPTIPWAHKGNAKSPETPAETCSPLALSAGTGLFCSAPDYAKFVTAHLQAMTGMPTVLYRPATASHLYADACGAKSTPGGWFIESRDWAGGEGFKDAGRFSGFGMSCWYAPKKGKAYFSIANVDGDAVWQIVHDAVDLARRFDAG